MGFFVQATYVIQPEKWGVFIPSTEKRLKYMKENPEKFKELKSWKLLSHDLGGKAGQYSEMWEFDSLAEYQKWHMRMITDKDYMKIINQEFMSIIVGATWSRDLWDTIMQI